MKLDIVGRNELVDSIPWGFNKDEIVEKKVLKAYMKELSYIIKIAQQGEKEGHEISVIFNKFDGYTAFFSVSAIDKPVKDEYNWFGQNTSRWLYAGCIQVNKDGSVSTHH